MRITNFLQIFFLFNFLSISFCFDYIVIGGGGAGCSLTRELVNRGKVLLIERGRSPSVEPLSQNLGGWPRIFSDVTSKTDPSDDIRSTEGIWTIAPRILGGGTSLNAGVWVRENEDYFESLGFNFTQVMKSYENVESLLNISAQPKTSAGSYLYEAFKSTGFSGVGSDRARQFGVQNTFSSFQPSGRRDRRSAEKLLPYGHPNFTLWTEHLVNRIIFDETSYSKPRAIGVSVTKVASDETFEVFLTDKSKGTVIVSAGAIHSPYLLLKSGVGPSSLDFESFGIRRVSRNEGVGVGLKDKPCASLGIFSRQEFPQTNVEVIANSEGYAAGNTGGGEIVSVSAGVFVNWISPTFRFGFIRQFYNLIFQNFPKALQDYLNRNLQVFTLIPSPKSSGQVTLERDLWTSELVPKVTIGYYTDPQDLEQHAKNMQKTFKVLNTQQLLNFVNAQPQKTQSLNWFERLIEEVLDFLYGISFTKQRVYKQGEIPALPTLFKDPENLNEVRNWILHHYAASYHHTGSMSEALDEEFNVISTLGLKVIDASAIKITPRTHPQATVVMLGNYLAKTLNF